MDKIRTLSTNRQTRGGQIYFHEWRMRLQNFRMVARISLIFGLAGLILGFFIFDISYWQIIDFYMLTYLPTKLKVLMWPFFKACLLDLDLSLKGLMPGSKGIPAAYLTLSDLQTTLKLENKNIVVINSVVFLNHPWTQHQLISIYRIVGLSFISWLLGVIYMLYSFKRKSDQVDQEKHLSGKKLKTAHQVSREVIAHSGQPTFYIAPKIPLPKGTENQHIAIFGTTRMGKTNSIIGMLSQIRRQGERAIILDVTGELTAQFYRHNHDKLLNPFDKRSVNWNIWQEQLPQHEYEAWAQAMVPDGKGDPIWHGNARKLLAYTAHKLEGSSNPTMSDILRWCCWQPLNNGVVDFYANSPVASFMIKEAEKTAAGVRMQLSSTISAFEYLNNTNQPFSLTKWIANSKSTDEWLFLTTLPSQRSALAPLLISWFNLAFLGLERSGIDFKHRLWLIADELPGLDIPVSGLKRMIAEGAKYGACCMIGFQNKSQIDYLYGQASAKSILSNCSTKVIFRSPDYETAKELSCAIGEQEVLSVTESYSVGAHQVRDGVNLQGQHRKKFVVTPEEIMALNPLEAYILLPGNYPAVKTKFTIHNFKSTTNAFEKD